MCLKIKKQLDIFVLKNIYRGNVYDYFIRKNPMFINVNFNKVVFAFKFKPRLNLMFDPKDNLRSKSVCTVKNSIGLDLFR
jgi:hypothetical protein